MEIKKTSINREEDGKYTHVFGQVKIETIVDLYFENRMSEANESRSDQFKISNPEFQLSIIRIIATALGDGLYIEHLGDDQIEVLVSGSKVVSACYSLNGEKIPLAKHQVLGMLLMEFYLINK